MNNSDTLRTEILNLFDNVVDFIKREDIDIAKYSNSTEENKKLAIKYLFLDDDIFTFLKNESVKKR